MDNSIHLQICISLLPSVMIQFEEMDHLDILHYITLTNLFDDIILIHLDLQEITRTVEVLVKHVIQNIGDKLYEDSGACHIYKYFEGLLVSIVPGQLLQSKREVISFCITYIQKEAQYWWASGIPRDTSLAHKHKRLTTLNGMYQCRNELSSRSRMWCEYLCHLGATVWQDL